MSDLPAAKSDLGFPASPYPSLALPHSLEVFPAGLPLYATPFWTFDADTVLRVLADMSLQALLRAEAPRVLSTIKQAVAAGRGIHKPTQTTRKLVLQTFANIVPEANVLRMLEAQEWQEEAAPGWELTILHTGVWADAKLKGICERFALWESRALEARSLSRGGDRPSAEDLVRRWFGSGLTHWLASAPTAMPQVLVLIETSLDALADFERRVHPVVADRPEASYFEGLLKPQRRPIGHWLQEVTQASGLEGFQLTELSNKLAGVASYLGRPIQPGLLHRWSSSRDVMLPRAAVSPVLSAVTDEEARDTLSNRYYIARLFTFLCDLLRAASADPQPTRDACQAALASRYVAVFAGGQQRP